MDERTFVVALRTLMDGQPGAAAVAFGLLHAAANDSLVRARAHGLTMALVRLRLAGNVAVARHPSAADSIPGSLAVAAGSSVGARAEHDSDARVQIPDQPVVLPMRRSFLGTPVITSRSTASRTSSGWTRGRA